MSAKKSKLEKQFRSEAQIEGVKKNIFNGTSIFVNGYTVPSADELKHFMMDYGGIYHHYYKTGNTTFMVASNLPHVKIQHYKNSAVKIIKPSWVTDCIEAGKILDHKPYLLLSDFDKEQKQLNFFKANPSTSSASTSTEIINAVSPSKVEKKLNPSPKRKTAVDDNFLDEFYSNSRLHHISTLSATFKQYINELRIKRSHQFTAREFLKNLKLNTPNMEEYQPVQCCIMHIDMDCFFVSVGLRNRPELKEFPVAVTHAKGNRVPSDHAEDRRAEFELHEKRFKEKYQNSDAYKPWFIDIGESDSMAEVASCNYAARNFGIKNGMLLGQALKLCPNLKTIPYDFDGYKDVAYKLFGHVASYTLDIEAVSCDEMFVDCTSLLACTKVNVLEFATILRKEIQEITGCTCSTGFGPNRLIARLATKKAKPDGQFYVRPEESKDFIQDFLVSELPGVGRSISTKLANMNVQSCKELQDVPLSVLQAEFGNKMGQNLQRYSFGEDDRPLNFCHQRKSVSAEVNYGIRFQRKEEVEAFFKKLSAEVENRLNNVKMKGKAITLKLMIKAENAPKETAKFLGHGICDYVTKSVSLIDATADSEVIYRETMKIFNQLKVNPEDMRGVGIQMTKLTESKNGAPESHGRLDTFVVKIKKKDSPDGDTRPGPSSDVRITEENNSKLDEAGPSCSNKSKFNESEYDVTLSQVDTDYLAALPSNIKEEIIHGLRKRRKNNTSGDGNSRLGSTKNDNGVRKLNPLIPSTEMTTAITEWVSKEQIPKEYDTRMLSDYLQQLILKKEFESVNFIVNHFQKSNFLQMSPKKWSKNTFGWARAEVLGALVNAVFLIALCFSITVEACKRFIEPKEIHSEKWILSVGIMGLIVNIIGLFLFHGHGGHSHSHSSMPPHNHSRLTQLVTAGADANATDDNENDERFPPQHFHDHIHEKKVDSSTQMNMHGVFLHVLADALGSVIVIISATESALILLQTVPTHIQVDEIQRRLLEHVDGVLAVHEFHVWQLAGDRIIASAHIRCRNLSEYMKLAEKVKEFFHNEGIHSTTIQPEFVEIADFSENTEKKAPAQDCVLDCPKTDKSCTLSTCCGPSKKGRETPSPVDTPYLCRQRNNINSTQIGRGPVSEIIERGALLANTNHMHEAEASAIANPLNI
ncbi:hypothetical protein V9T40_004155 [Parthenolecanium corni]|uniref:DNA repair protein REV1 n=1 Tax=Parthenolecanium corni TaxID=536013 RepID=A0AAN9TUD4_9HEMI